MGLIARCRRLHYVWSWRARYWWLDTRQGELAHATVLVLSMLVFAVLLLRMFVFPAPPPPPGEPAKAIVWWVQLIVMVLAAAISYAMRPKPQTPQPQTSDIPTTEDGLAVKHHFGECWVEDEFQLAHKVVGTTKIRAKGKK